MNEEEKKSVEDSKELIKEFNNHKDKNLIGSLLEKLQKKHEELKSKNKSSEKSK